MQLKYLLIATIIVISSCQEPYVGKVAVTNECQTYRYNQNPQPQVFTYENKYNGLFEFRVVGWWRYSFNQLVQGTHTLFTFAQGQGNEQINKFAVYIDSSQKQITFCTYDMLTKNFNLCKSASIEIKMRTWLLVSFSYSPDKLKAYAVYQYYQDAKQDMAFNNIKHSDSNYYQLIVGQSGEQKNFPGYFCKLRLRSGPNAYSEEGFEDEWKQLPNDDSTNNKNPEPTSKYGTIGNQDVILEDYQQDYYQPSPVPQNVFTYRDIEDLNEFSIVGWFKIEPFVLNDVVTGYVIGNRLYPGQTIYDEIFAFKVTQFKQFQFWITRTDTEYKKATPDKNIYIRQNYFNKEFNLSQDTLRWFIVYQGYSKEKLKAVSQVLIPGQNPITIESNNHLLENTDLLRISVGFDHNSRTQNWNGWIRNLRVCLNKQGCFYDSYPLEEANNLAQLQSKEDKLLENKNEYLIIKQKTIKYTFPVFQILENPQHNELSISSWFRLTKDDQGQLSKGCDVFRYGLNVLYASPSQRNLSGEVGYNSISGHIYQQPANVNQKVFVIYVRYQSQTKPNDYFQKTHNVLFNQNEEDKWVYFYVGYQKQTQKVKVYVTLDGQVKVNETHNDMFFIHNLHQMVIMGGNLGENLVKFYGEMRNSKFCAGKGCYQEDGFESSAPEFALKKQHIKRK